MSHPVHLPVADQAQARAAAVDRVVGQVQVAAVDRAVVVALEVAAGLEAAREEAVGQVPAGGQVVDLEAVLVQVAEADLAEAVVLEAVAPVAEVAVTAVPVPAQVPVQING